MIDAQNAINGKYARIAKSHNSRAKRRGSAGTFTGEEWKNLLIKTGFKCARCKTSGHDTVLTVDHIEPISKGGRNDIGNLQPLCRTCNTTKNNFNSVNYMKGEEDPVPLDDDDYIEMYLHLDEILAYIKKNGHPLVRMYKTKLHDTVADELNKISNTKWGWRYVHSVHNGGLTPGRVFCHAVKETYKNIIAKEETKKQKLANRPNYRLRPLQVRCTKKQYDQILELSTVERAKILMKDKG